MTATKVRAPLARLTSREVVRGVRGGVHIAHPLADLTLCGKPIGERPGIDAFGRTSVDGLTSNERLCGSLPIAYHACRECQGRTFGGGGEERQAGAYA